MSTSVNCSLVEAKRNRRTRILDIAPTQLQQNVSVFLGSKREVEAAARYHCEHDARTRPLLTTTRLSTSSR